MEAIVRCAKLEDKNRLTAFLKRANLGTEGVEEAIDYFLIMENEQGEIKATMGIEPFNDTGLLRSLVMSPEATENDLLMLFEQMLMLATDRKMKSLYMATNKARSLTFFEMLGFVQENRQDLPQELFESQHVKHILTVDNSIFMKLSI